MSEVVLAVPLVGGPLAAVLAVWWHERAVRRVRKG